MLGTSYPLNQSTVLTKRTGYARGSALSAHTGEAYLDGLEFRVVPAPGVQTGSTPSAASGSRTKPR